MPRKSIDEVKAIVKRKPGRPPAIVADEKTLSQIRVLASQMNTKESAAAVMLVHRDTFVDFITKNEQGREAWEGGREMGKAILLRYQFEAAKRGNAALLIWLGKQYLGQKDFKILAGDNDAPPIGVQHSTDGRAVDGTDILLRAINAKE